MRVPPPSSSSRGSLAPTLRRVRLLVLATAALLGALIAPAGAFAAASELKHFGAFGAAAGQLPGAAYSGAVDATTGRLYVAAQGIADDGSGYDGSNTIVVFEADGTFVSKVSYPTDPGTVLRLAVDGPRKRLYALGFSNAESTSTVKYLSTADLTSAASDFIAPAGDALGGIRIAVDQSATAPNGGRVFVAYNQGNTSLDLADATTWDSTGFVREYTPAGTVARTIGKSAYYTQGNGETPPAPPATNGDLAPAGTFANGAFGGLAVDPANGQLIVIENAYDRVQRFQPDGTAIGVSAGADVSGVDSILTSAGTLFSPGSGATGTKGNVQGLDGSNRFDAGASADFPAPVGAWLPFNGAVAGIDNDVYVLSTDNDFSGSSFHTLIVRLSLGASTPTAGPTPTPTPRPLTPAPTPRPAVTVAPTPTPAPAPGPPAPGPVAPVAPVAPAAPAAPPTKAAVLTTFAQAPTLARKLTGSVKKGLALAVTCPAGGAVCEGKLVLTSTGRKPVSLAKGSYSIKAGAKATIKLKLTKAGKKAYKKAKKASAKLTATPNGGIASSQSVKLALKR